MIFGLIFFAYFYPKTWWSIQKWGIFIISLFFKSSDLVFWSKKDFFAVFGWYFTPWIRITGSAYFCRSGSRKPKSCGSNGSGFGSGSYALVLRNVLYRTRFHLIHRLSEWFIRFWAAVMFWTAEPYVWSWWHPR